MKQDELKNCTRPHLLSLLLLLEQVLKKVIEKSILKPLEFSSLFNFLYSRVLKCSGRAFCTLWFLFVKFCMLGREVVVCSVPSVMSMKFMSALS